jgi:hypothetical protein
MPSQFKIDELLKDHAEDREEFEKYARDPGRSIDELENWLASHGYVVSRGAVWNWKQEFDKQVMAERFSRSSELARAIKGAVSSNDFEAVADAAAMQLTQVVFEQAAKLEQDGELDPLDVQRMTRSLANLVGSKQKLIAMLAEKFDKEASKLVAAANGAQKRQITQADIDEVRKAVFG